MGAELAPPSARRATRSGAVTAQLGGLAAAYRFLSSLPIPGPLGTAADLPRALPYFPLVGLTLGGILVALDVILGPYLARPLVDLTLLGALVVLSGGLHLDGLIDTADGLLGPGPPERRLAAMRESWAGPRGATAALALLLVEYAALSALDGPARWPALLLAPILGRWAIVYGYVAFPYARRTVGLSLALKEGGSVRVGAITTAFALAAVCLLSWPAGPLLLLCAWAVAVTGGWIALRRLGGMSGDVYGAVEQIVEAIVLVLAPLVLPSSR